MNITLRNQYLSRQRFNRYLIAAGNDNRRAKRLYAANIKLAQAFHPVLSQFEVVFRNALYTKLAAHFSDPNWIINQKRGFMSNPSLARSQFFLRSCVEKTESNLRYRSVPVTAGKIISDQMFGFWLSFFVPHHYSLAGGQPIYTFPYKPGSETRASLHQKLDDIKNYRNRMNHCEPLCFNVNTVDCSNALAIRTLLYQLIDWIDPALRSILKL